MIASRSEFPRLSSSSTPHQRRRHFNGPYWWSLFCLALIVAAVVLAAAAWGANTGHDDPARETVDLIEVNSFFDEQGRLVFDQVIFYDWSIKDCDYRVRAWRLIKSPSQRPYRDWTVGGWLATWHDGELIRHVRAESLRETWTQFDPELSDRDFLPKERRRELRTVKAANVVQHPPSNNRLPATPPTPATPNQER